MEEENKVQLICKFQLYMVVLPWAMPKNVAVSDLAFISIIDGWQRRMLSGIV